MVLAESSKDHHQGTHNGKEYPEVKERGCSDMKFAKKRNLWVAHDMGQGGVGRPFEGMGFSFGKGLLGRNATAVSKALINRRIG